MRPPIKPDTDKPAPVAKMFAGREMADVERERRVNEDPDLRLVLHWQKLFADKARKTGSA